MFVILQLSILQKQHLDELNKEVKGEKVSFESNVSDKKSATDTEDVEVDHLQEGKDEEAMLKSSMSRKQRGLYEAIQVDLLILYAILISIILCDINYIVCGIGKCPFGLK